MAKRDATLSQRPIPCCQRPAHACTARLGHHECHFLPPQSVEMRYDVQVFAGPSLVPFDLVISLQRGGVMVDEVFPAAASRQTAFVASNPVADRDRISGMRIAWEYLLILEWLSGPQNHRWPF